MSRRQADIKLSGFASIFQEEADQNSGEEQVVRVPLSELHMFRKHPFRVLEDEKMQETVESVKKYGILIPGLVRPFPGGGYEVIAGHRRWKASLLAGLKDMPVIIRELSDDEAVVAMVDTNIQREDILPSEKARAYAMKYEAIKHQGSKGEKYTAELVGETAGESGRTVQRYIRLAKLNEELLDQVDRNYISLGTGESLSYLNLEEQQWLVQILKERLIVPDKLQAIQLKEESLKKQLSKEKMYTILLNKEKHRRSVTFSAKMVKQYFPSDFTQEEIKKVICQLLEEWKAKQR